MTDVYLHVGVAEDGNEFPARTLPSAPEGRAYRPSVYGLAQASLVERLWRVAEAYPLFVDMAEQRAEIERFLLGATEDKLLITSERLVGDTQGGVTRP